SADSGAEAARARTAAMHDLIAPSLLGEADGTLHPILVVAGNVAGEFEVAGAHEGPDEAGGLAGIDPDPAFVRHLGHRMAGMAALLHLLEHRLHRLAMLGMLGHRADRELVRIPAFVAHDEAHRLAVAHIERLERELVVYGDHLDGARDLGRIAGTAAAR